MHIFHSWHIPSNFYWLDFIILPQEFELVFGNTDRHTDIRTHGRTDRFGSRNLLMRTAALEQLGVVPMHTTAWDHLGDVFMHKTAWDHLGMFSLPHGSSSLIWHLKVWPCGFKIEYTNLGFVLAGAVWLGIWNFDHVVLKLSIHTSASPRQQRSKWSMRVTKDTYFSLLTHTK